jgi:Ca2+-binding RTX toxin-like protein
VFGRSAPSESVTVLGQDGRDMLWTGAGEDILVGGNGGDWLSGGNGNDKLYGGNLPGDGADSNADGTDWEIDGMASAFNDVLDGGAGEDIVVGGAGNDLISGGTDDDTLSGGAGADTFLFRFNSTPAGWGSDIILDFNHAQGDKLHAYDWDASKVTAIDTGDDLVLNYEGMGEIVLKNFELGTLELADLFG